MVRTVARSVVVAAVASVLLLVAGIIGIQFYALASQQSIEIPAVFSVSFSPTGASVAVRPLGSLVLYLALTVLLTVPVGLVLRTRDTRAGGNPARERSSEQTAASAHETDQEGEDAPAWEWHPSWLTIFVWTALSFPLAVAGVVLFGLIYSATHGGGGEIRTVSDSIGLLFALALLIAVFVAHELVHGLAMRLFGARPIYGAGMIKKVLPCLYCAAPGHRFSPRQFVVIGLAPAIVISVVGALWVAFGPYGGWMVPIMGIHLAGCIGDFWMVPLAALQPRQVEIEDTGADMRVWGSVGSGRRQHTNRAGSDEEGGGPGACAPLP